MKRQVSSPLVVETLLPPYEEATPSSMRVAWGQSGTVVCVYFSSLLNALLIGIAPAVALLHLRRSCDGCWHLPCNEFPGGGQGCWRGLIRASLMCVVHCAGAHVLLTSYGGCECT